MSEDDRDRDPVLSALIRGAMPPLTAPDSLREAIRARLRPPALALPPRDTTPSRWSLASPRASRWLMAASVLAVVAAGSWSLGVIQGRDARRTDAVAQGVLASHLRSLVGDHLTDVASTDRHTVKPWFAGKLDYAPPVADLTAQGFPLVGGRIDYIGGRRVAALVYTHGAHKINVFVWPASASEPPPGHAAIQGYTMLHWTSGGLSYWAVSDADLATLGTLATLIGK
jgi:anti-sigma factor RsiW